MDSKTLIGFFQNHLQNRDSKPNTITGYVGDVWAFADWLEDREQVLVPMDAKTVKTFIDDMKVERQWKPATTNRKLASLLRFYEFLKLEMETDGVTENPVSGIKRKPVRSLARPAHDGVAIEALLHAPNPDDPIGLRDQVTMKIIYQTGMGNEELLALTVNDLKKSSAIWLKVDDSLSNLIREYLRVRPDILLEKDTPYFVCSKRGDRITRQALWHIVKNAAKKAGLGKEVNPDWLRRMHKAKRAQPRGLDYLRSRMEKTN